MPITPAQAFTKWFTEYWKWLLTTLIIPVILIVFKNKEIGEMGSRSFDLNFFDSSIIRPFITMFNSSYFISIPLTIILISFMFYFLFSLIKPVSNKNFGNI